MSEKKYNRKSFFQKLTDSFVSFLPLNSTIKEGGENIDRNQQFSPIRNSRFASEAFPELDQTNSRIKRAKLHHDPMNLPQSRILKPNSPINSDIINNYNCNDTASELSDTSISTSGVSSLHPRSFKRFNLGVASVRDLTIKTNIQNLNKSINIDSIIRKDNSNSINSNSNINNNCNNINNKTFMSSSSRKILEHLDRLTTPVTANEKLTASLFKYSQSYRNAVVNTSNPYYRNAPPRNMKPLPPMKAVTISASANNNSCGPIRRKNTQKSTNEIINNNDKNIDLDLENTFPSLQQSTKLDFKHVPLLTVSKSTNTDEPLKNGQSSPILQFHFSNPLKIDDFDYLSKNDGKSETFLLTGEKKMDFIKSAAETNKSVPLESKTSTVSTETGFSFTGGKNSAKSVEESSKSAFLSSNSSFGTPKSTSESISTSGTVKFGAPSTENTSKAAEKPLESQKTAFGTPLSFGTDKTIQSTLFGTSSHEAAKTTSTSIFGVSSAISDSKAKETPLTAAQVTFCTLSSPNLAISPFVASKTDQSKAIGTSISSFGTPSTQPMTFGALLSTNSSIATPKTTQSFAFGADSSITLPKSIETPLITQPMAFEVSSSSNTSISSSEASKTTQPMAFGAFSSTNSPFGTSAATQSMSFAANPSTNSPFGAPSASTPSISSFGTSATQPMTFGVTPSTNSPFGTSSATQSIAFGALSSTTSSNSSLGTSSISSFGTSSATQSMTFGAPLTQPMAFGVTPSTDSSFGAPLSSTPSISSFGTSTTTSKTTPPMIFGALTSTTASISPFGAALSSTPSISSFGTLSSQPMAFGGLSSTTPSNSSFGAPSTPSVAFGVNTSTISPFGAPLSSTPSMTFGAPSATPSISSFGASSNNTAFQFSTQPSAMFNQPSTLSNSQLSSTFKFGQAPAAGNTASGLATGAFVGTTGTNITNNFQPLLPSNKNFAFDSSLPPPSSSQNIGGTFQFGAGGSTQQFGSGGGGSGNMFSGSNSVPSSMDKLGANGRRFAKSRRKR